MKQRLPKYIEEEIEAAGGLEAILAELPDMNVLDEKAMKFGALSDPIRLRILTFLAHQRSCVCLLHEITGLPYPKLSYHLSVLKNAGLISSKKSGRYMIYAITEEGKKYIERIL